MKDLKARKSGKNQAVNQSVRVTREEKLEAKGAEKKNYLDMTQNMKKEHQRLKKRLEVVGDPNYSLTLRKKIMDIKDQIQSLEEVKRKMTNDKFGRERRMNKVIMAGQNDAMVETQEKVKELTVLFDRVHKINKKLKSEENTKIETDENINKLQEKLSKLESEATEQGLNIQEVYNQNEEDIAADNAFKDPEFYERRKKIMESAKQTVLNKYAYKLEHIAEYYETVILDRNDTITKIKQKHEEILNRRFKANELMIKTKVMTLEQADEQEKKYKHSLEKLPEIIDLGDDELMNQFKIVLYKEGRGIRLETLRNAPKPLIKSPTLMRQATKSVKPDDKKPEKGKKDSIITEYDEHEDNDNPKKVVKSNKVDPKISDQDNNDLKYDFTKTEDKSDDEKSLKGESTKKPLFGDSTKPALVKKPTIGGRVKARPF